MDLGRARIAGPGGHPRLTSLLAAAGALLLTAADSGNWLRARPPGEGFGVSVPVRLSRLEDEIATPEGPGRVVLHYATHEQCTYSVAYTEYPVSFVRRVEPTALLEAYQRKMLREAGAKLARRQEILVDVLPGREIEFTSAMKGDSGAPTGRILTIARLFWLENRLYAVMGAGPESKRTDSRIRRFLGSFEVPR